MYGVAVCGWTVGVYILQVLWENIRPILTTYQKYVVWYIVCTGVVSFIGKYFERDINSRADIYLLFS